MESVKRKPGPAPWEIRNNALIAYYAAGHTVRETAKAFRVSPQRVGQLVRGLRSAAETIKLRREK